MSPLFSHASLGEEPQPAHWSGIFAMSLCVFTLIASEFMPVSLLTPIAAELQISEGQAGQAIAVSGAFAVLTSLLISMLVRDLDRKIVLLSLTGIMVISGTIVALAPNYEVLMLGRALLGVVIGGFWSMSAATAMRLVPKDKISQALSIFNGGNALATVIAPPLGAFIGSIVGWRGAFFSVVPIGVIVLVWQWVSLPSMKSPRQPASATPFKLLKRPLITRGMTAVGLFFMGQFALFTYVRPFLETVTRIDVSTLSLVLLGIGLSGLIGTSLVGSLLKIDLYRVLIAIPLVMAAIALLLIAIGSNLPMTAFALCVWGMVGTTAPVIWWTWLSQSLPEDAEAGGGLMVAVIQLAITLGAVIGGILFDMSGFQIAFATAAGLLLLGAVFGLLTAARARL